MFDITLHRFQGDGLVIPQIETFTYDALQSTLYLMDGATDKIFKYYFDASTDWKSFEVEPVAFTGDSDA